jgi:hypothetical protein
MSARNYFKPAWWHAHRAGFSRTGAGERPCGTARNDRGAFELGRAPPVSGQSAGARGSAGWVLRVVAGPHDGMLRSVGRRVRACGWVDGLFRPGQCRDSVHCARCRIRDVMLSFSGDKCGKPGLSTAWVLPSIEGGHPRLLGDRESRLSLRRACPASPGAECHGCRHCRQWRFIVDVLVQAALLAKSWWDCPVRPARSRRGWC